MTIKILLNILPAMYIANTTDMQATRNPVLAVNMAHQTLQATRAFPVEVRQLGTVKLSAHCPMRLEPLFVSSVLRVATFGRLRDSYPNSSRIARPSCTSRPPHRPDGCTLDVSKATAMRGSDASLKLV